MNNIEFKELHRTWKRYNGLTKTLNYLMEIQQEGMGEPTDLAKLDIAIDVIVKLRKTAFIELTQVNAN